MSDCYCVLRDDIPTPLDPIRHLFERDCIPILAPIPTALVDEQECYEIDARRLNDDQVQALAEHVLQKYQGHPEMPGLDTAIAIVQEGLPIGKCWTSGVGGGAKSAAALMDFEEDWFSGNSQDMQWFESEKPAAVMIPEQLNQLFQRCETLHEIKQVLEQFREVVLPPDTSNAKACLKPTPDPTNLPVQ